MQIEEIWMSQRKLRNIAQVAGMVQTIKEGGFLPRILIGHDKDGSVQLEDGHHRLVAYWLAGKSTLSGDEYLLLEKDQWRPRFGKIHELLLRCDIG